MINRIQTYFSYPRDFETVRRSILRKSSFYKNRSSFPFISGDTFKNMCDYIISSRDLNREKFEYLCKANFKNNRFFLTAYPKSTIAFDFIDFLRKNDDLNIKKFNIIIHNGDVIPDSAQLEYLSSRVSRVYAVNWLGSSKIAKSLPIGLENYELLRNGVPSDFNSFFTHNLKPTQKDIDLLICFSLSTNLTERLIALETSRKVPGAYEVKSAITPSRYRQLVKQSKYVLSPPGNGPDCHRTWESLYLGATPIVLKKSWPFNNLNLPIATVNNWNEVNSIVRSNRYLSFSNFEWWKIEKWFN